MQKNARKTKSSSQVLRRRGLLSFIVYILYCVSPVGVAPTRTVGTSAYIIFRCSIKIQKTEGGETQPVRSTALC